MDRVGGLAAGCGLPGGLGEAPRAVLWKREHRTLNAEHPTSNRREPREKDGPFRLLFSPLLFDVGRSMLDVRRSYSFFRREVLWIVDFGLEESRELPAGNANIEH